MAGGRFQDRINEVSGRAKTWAGRVAGDRSLEREGRTQSGFARAKLAVRDLFRPRRGGRRHY